MNKIRSDISAIILAAGKGTRFKSREVNKVALPLLGKPIICYSVELLEKLGIPIFVVVGFAKNSVIKALSGYKVSFVEQREQRGTGDALHVALKQFPEVTQNVLIVNGDDPFHKKETIERLIQVHKQSNAAIAFITSQLTDPTGMGRIVRDLQGNVVAIVEEKDASDEQRKIKEVNGACYLFRLDFLRKYLPKLKKSNITDEYYITELITMAVRNREKVETIPAGDNKRRGINTPEDLKEAEKLITSQNPDT